MTTLPKSRLATGAAAFTALLLLAAAPEAEAKSGGGVKNATSSYGYKPSPVVRDHRQNPRPWSLPRHYHRH